MTEKTYIIYLLKDKFEFYSPVNGSAIEFRFVPEIVNDLDVINPELFESLIKLFVANNKITFGSIVIVIADNASFIKDFITTNNPPNTLKTNTANNVSADVSIPAAAKENTNEEIKSFIEHVPFDDVASDTYPLSSGTKIWATNRELFTAIADAFKKQRFEVEAVLPGLVFEGNISSKATMDPAMAGIILQTFDSVKQHSLLSQKPVEPQAAVTDSKEESKKIKNTEESYEINDTPKTGTNKKRLFVMIGIFVILIIILILVYVGSLRQNP